MSDITYQPPFTNIEYLFNNYYSRLCYYAFKIINNQEAAKDLVQDVYLSYWNKKTVFETESAIKNFLYLSVRNACLNFIRHDLVEKKFSENTIINSIEQEKGLDHIIKAEVLGEVQKAIEALPDGCKLVLKLAFFEGLKNEQIAQEMGISINTVKTQKQRALQLLRIKLSTNAYVFLLVLLSN